MRISAVPVYTVLFKSKYRENHSRSSTECLAHVSQKDDSLWRRHVFWRTLNGDIRTPLSELAVEGLVDLTCGGGGGQASVLGRDQILGFKIGAEQTMQMAGNIKM